MPDFTPTCDAFAITAHIPSDELLAGRCATEVPLLSIMIVTHRRPDLLVQAVASALAQDWGEPFEVVVLDDDPASVDHERLRTELPAIAEANFRYLRNRHNLRLYPNSNRCVVEARGAWITILHDDDLLDPNWARAMFALLRADPRIDGLVCRKRFVDERAAPFRHGRIGRLARRAHKLAQFGLRPTRVIDARKLFWGCVTGNTVGFVCRTADMRALGGFQPEDEPSSDYWFYARFAARHRLAQTGGTHASIRIAVNSLLRDEVQLACLEQNHRLQQALAASLLPPWYRRLIPASMSRQIAVTARFWAPQQQPRDVHAQLGIEKSAIPASALQFIRAISGGL